MVFNITFCVLPDKVLLIKPLETLRPGEKLIQDSSNTKQVCLRITSLMIQYFWTNIPWCSTSLRQFNSVFDKGCKTKVSNYKICVAFLGHKKQVLWLQITVDYLVGVQVL